MKLRYVMRCFPFQKICTLNVFLLAFLVIGCEGTRAASPQFSEQAFPTNEFFGGISVDIDGLRKHPRYQLFPLDELIPAATSLNYLNSELISQFAFFLKHSESKRGSDQRFEIAAIGKLRNADSFDAKSELAKWSNRTTPWRDDVDVAIEEIQVDGKTCFQFETGTVLNPIRRAGKTRFFDRDGKKSDRGINVGSMTDRGFISGGGKKSKAVITATNVSSDDLIDGQLVIDLHLDVFLTRKLEYPFPESQVYLLSSDGSFRSEPVDFDAKSFFVHQFSFPGEIPVFDTESGEPKGNVDLIGDLVTNGELKLVLRCLEDLTYLGIEDSDFSLRIPGHEYLGVVGEFVVVTQSLDRLKQMMKLDEKTIAEKIALQKGQQVEASFDLTKSENKTAFKDFLKTLKLQHVLAAMTSTTDRVQFSINVDQEKMFSAEIGMSAADARSIAKQISSNCQQLTEPSLRHRIDRQITYKLNDESDKFTGVLATELFDTVRRQQVMAKLREAGFTFIFGQQREAFQDFEGVDASVFPDSSIDIDSLVQPCQTLAENLAESVRAEKNSDGLAIDFHWPFAEPNELNQLEFLTLALMRRYRAIEHFNMKRFYFSEQIERRLISEFPNNEGLWASLAHQLAFNTAPEFNGEATKYFWVRKGIGLLLDMAETNENSADAISTAAFYVAFKIGASDEQKEFRKLFDNDKALLDRIGKYVDLEKCLDSDGIVNCELVGRGMLEHSNQQRRKNGKANSWNVQLEMATQPIGMLTSHARWLDNQFKNEVATKQWQIALQELKQLEEHVVEFDATTKLKLKDVKENFAKIVFQENCEKARRHASWCESQISQIQLRLSPTGTKALSHFSKAVTFQVDQDSESALAEFRSALKIIHEFTGKDPEKVRSARLTFKDLFEKANALHEQMQRPLSVEYRDMILLPLSE